MEQPKLAFETPGQNGQSDTKGQAKLTPPKTSVQEVVRDIARGGGGQSVAVGDLDQPPDLPESIHLPSSMGRTGSSLELMSDPMGVDFKPYLTQILALVRKNWFAVMAGKRAARQSRLGAIAIYHRSHRPGAEAGDRNALGIRSFGSSGSGWDQRFGSVPTIAERV